MSKKKILSILMISLIVLGTVLFVVNSLQANDGYSDEFKKCVDYCFKMGQQGYDTAECIAIYCVKKLWNDNFLYGGENEKNTFVFTDFVTFN